jgi:hypothetical protein
MKISISARGEAIYERTQSRYSPHVTNSGKAFRSWLPLWLTRLLFR